MTLLLSLNFVVATDMNATLSEQISTNVDYTSEGYDDYLNLVNVDDEYQINENQDSYLSSESSKVIYVGNNSGLGEGSFDNPYPNFKSACDNVNGEDNVTINVFAGTYYLGEGLADDIQTPLRFNVTGNLNIVGNGTVIIKNYFDDYNNYDAEAFSLTSALANVTFSDIIFDASGRTVQNYAADDWGEYQYFVPFYGKTNLATFTNCSFVGNRLGFDLSGAGFNSKFVNCYFDCNGVDEVKFVEEFASNTVHVFEYCILDFGDCERLQYINLPCTISFENVWFGQNTLPRYITPPDGTALLNNKPYSDYVIPVSRYAVFDVTENYLGNNQFEIVGKLTWNGTSNQDGMENFQPMTVNLVSDTGDIDSTVSLVNGNFRTVYTSSSDIHRVNATLHNQLVPLEFTSSSGAGESSKVIYVGQNVTADGGNGSFDNPFRTFKLACDNVNGEDNVTINVFAGTYYLGEGFPEDASESELNCLKFNCNNLNIIGNGTVIIKNYHDHDGYNAECFSFTSNSSKFNFTNLIFDASNSNWHRVDSNRFNLFMPFFGETELGIFDNCSFIGFGHKAGIIISEMNYNAKFINCNLECGNTGLFNDEFQGPSTSINHFTQFENCIINIPNPNVWSFCRFNVDKWNYNSQFNVSMSNVWLGQNELPIWIKLPTLYYQSNIYIPINRYANFTITQNYLGNNTYGIVGKLTWNGTSDQDGMENFQPMTVTLKSVTGDINQTATLVNGNFRTIYTSSNPSHNVTVMLHSEEIELEFANVNITSIPTNIYYGDDQNITFNFTQPITANVTVTVSNGSYTKSERVEVIGKDSLLYTVPDTLKEGTYDVEINLADNNLFGFNTTTLTVSKVSDYIFDVATSDVNFGDNATISITLPNDVNGTIVIKFGNDTKELPANQTMTVNFTNLNITTYSVNVSYSGNDKYVAKDYPTASVKVGPADSGLEIEGASFIYGEIISIPFNVTNADGVNVIVYNKDDDEVATTSSESGIINLDALPAGKYSLDVETIVGSNYASVRKTIDLTINKANSSLDISDKEFAYASEAVINAVTEYSTDDVIARLTDENNTEIAVTVSGDSITLPKLNTGIYTLTVTTNPDENHTNVSKSVTITISKITPAMNVVVEPAVNITAKDDVTLTVSLPSDATGEVTVKVNGKKVDFISANETIIINLNNKATGDYVVDITYSGDKNYESDSATKEFTISKAETSITAKQIDFEEGNASKIEITVPNVESGIVLVDVAGKKFYGDIDSGNAIVIIEGVDAGNYTANVKFFGDDKYKEATTTADVQVSEAKIITELKEQLDDANAKVDNLTGELSDANKLVDNLNTQLNETQANATKLAEDLADANSKVDNLTTQLDKAQSNVTVVVDGVEYPVDVINGTVTIKTNSTKPIAKKDTVIDVDNAFTRVANDYNACERGGMFYVTLRDIDGNVLVNKTVQIALNGKIYNKTTDDEGRAGLQVNLANAGTYTYAISFQGDDQYNAAPMASSKLTVAKKKTTIKASNKVFKAKTKTKKISVTLKTVKNKYDNKTYLKSGKKVTLKVNGKTYTAKINKKGVAKFTIKITKKGKYTAKIKFAGDKTYKASSKTIKIRIK